MIKKCLIFCLSLTISEGFCQEPVYTNYVDPMIGTGGHGHTFPGATVPFGMVQLSPDTRIDGSWDGCSGYHYSDSVIYGFSHTHLSGTGCSDFGDVMIMPVMGKGSFMSKDYSSKFSHRTEIAQPGYYSVMLDEEDIKVELTTSTRVGLHKYTFNRDGEVAIILDLQHRDKLLMGRIDVRDDKTIEGYRSSEAWARNQQVWFNISFSKPFTDKQILSGDNPDLKGIFHFNVKKGESILVKVALSPVSNEGARKNMESEMPYWDFEKGVNEAKLAWNKELSKIEVFSKDQDKMKIFYTALYHTMIQPNVAMDVDGMYMGRDAKPHKAEGFTYYSVFSLWDTFRGAHPLYTIIDQKRTSDFINTFLKQYEQGGRLPVWELAGNETDCMIGYHSVSVIADAMVKGIKGFDYKEAFEAAKHSATLDHLGLKAYKEKGFISMEDEHESVSKTLEYAYDDWCIAQMALVIGERGYYEGFMKRSQNWKNLFDPETGFMRPKKNGGWLTPFEPREVNNNFTEGNSWQYTFFVPQDINGLIRMMGGADKFEKKLDDLFSAPTATTGREQADITGLIGQYAHGNEPSHHMAYLYNYVGKHEKTVKVLQQIMNDFYKTTPDGLIGNEDCGQMSAWYVLNAMGIYQVTPGSDFYNMGTPFFESVKINLESGKKFDVSANLSPEQKYIRSVSLNGKDYYNLFLKYDDIEKGSSLKEVMINKPYEWHCFRTECYPLSEVKDEILPVPVIQTVSRVFDDSLRITLTGGTELWYSMEDPGSFQQYTGPFTINKTQTIGVYSGNSSHRSEIVSGTFYKRPNHWKVIESSKYNPQYTAGGELGLIDGLRGETNWRKGEWQGYQYQDFECVIDFGQKEKFTRVSAGFLQDSRSWILFPSKVEFYASGDGKEFILIATETHNIDPMDEKVQIKEFADTGGLVKARYLKVKAYNYGKLPAGHQGYGDSAFIFIDEISIK